MEFRHLRDGDRALIVAAEFEDAALALGLLEPGGLETLLRAGNDGGHTAVVALPDNGARLHLRAIHHRGLLGPALADRLLGLRRPAAELTASARLAARGAPVARPVLAAGTRIRGPLWRAALGTIHEEGARDGLAFLRGSPEPADVLTAAAAAGRAVRRLHDAGGRHPDLHAGNLLLRHGASGCEVVVVDLDRARVAPRVSASERMTEFMRLYRSLLKHRVSAAVGARGCAHFLSAYTAGDRDLRRALLAHLPRERARLAVHRASWRWCSLR
jgi:tRNA A-37 threonylcarbamoyl transferase component Bud32